MEHPRAQICHNHKVVYRKKSVEKLDGFGLTNCKLKRGDGRWNERAVK